MSDKDVWAIALAIGLVAALVVAFLLYVLIRTVQKIELRTSSSPWPRFNRTVARLPVYALLIGAFIPQRAVGVFNLRGLVLFALYLAGVVSALAVAFVMIVIAMSTFAHIVGRQKERAAAELATKLDELLVEADISTLENAIRFMGLNTRNTLLRAIEMSGTKVEENS